MTERGSADRRPDDRRPDDRLETEEAARTGRFPTESGEVRDDSNPIEPEGEFDRGVDTEHLRSPSQGARPEEVPDEGAP